MACDGLSTEGWARAQKPEGMGVFPVEIVYGGEHSLDRFEINELEIIGKSSEYTLAFHAMQQSSLLCPLTHAVELRKSVPSLRVLLRVALTMTTPSRWNCWIRS